MEKVNDVLKNLNILYAEDDETIRVNTSKTLELFCHKVFQADNGVAALELFHQESIDLVILDYVMPLMDGSKVADEIRKCDKNIPIFITSSYTEKDKLLSMIGLNIVAYLEKPISFPEMMKALKKSTEILIENKNIISRLSESVHYDHSSKSLTVDDAAQVLSKNEYLFIEMLLKHKPSVVQTHFIEKTIFPSGVEPNALRNMVYRLRKKMGKDIIVSIRDVGYMLKDNA